MRMLQIGRHMLMFQNMQSFPLVYDIIEQFVAHMPVTVQDFGFNFTDCDCFGHYAHALVVILIRGFSST